MADTSSRNQEDRSLLSPPSSDGGAAVGAGGRGGWVSWFATTLRDLADEVSALRKLVRRQGVAREEAEARLQESFAALAAGAAPTAPASPVRARPPEGALSTAQLEALCRLDEAVLHLLRVAEGADDAVGDELAPATSREALAMLQVRVRNLQRSFGLVPVPAQGSRFDDRVHRVHAVCHRRDLADGVVAEELLPGYTLGTRLIRPAAVVVNRCPAGKGDSSP